MRSIFLQLLAVGAAGSAGSVARYLVGVLCGRLFGHAFPVGTLVINLTGSLFLGWFLAMMENRPILTDTFRLAIATGFVGAYTTFSTFAFESNSLIESGSNGKALVNLVGSVVLGLLAVRLGIWLAGR